MDDTLNAQRTRARIEQAIRQPEILDGWANPDYNVSTAIGRAAAREALQMVKERLEKELVKCRAAYYKTRRECFADSDLKAGAVDAARNAVAIVDELLADLASDEAGKD